MSSPAPVWRRIAATVLALGVLTAAGCGIRIPSDPDGTLDRITGHELRVGASASEGLVAIDDDVVSGPLPSLIEGFAAERDAEVVWTVDSEERLVDRLENGRLDLAIGGMTDSTPWAERVSITRGYADVPGADGRRVVVLMPLGENALQTALETYLDGAVR